MATLNVALATAGLSAASGVQLIASREQLDATLPRGKGAVEPAADAGSTSALRANPETKASTAKELSPEQRRQIAELARIDREVRAHEAAHLRVGAGVVTSGANFSYVYGPDGKSYAVAGEVGIDTSPEEEPEANIDKGQRIQVVALAPAEPSPQDYQIAAVGERIEQLGYSGVAKQQALEQTEKTITQSEDRTRRSDGAGNAGPASDAAGESTRALLARSYPPAPTNGKSGISLFA